MAEENRKDRGVSSTVAIPSGLNRIKTRLASSGPRPEDSSDTVLKPPFNRNQKTIVPRGHGRTTGSSKQERKGTKLSRWLASYKPKYSCHPPKYACSSTTSSEEIKLRGKNSGKDEEKMIKISETNPPCSKSMGIKSFSHELGPRGGVQTPYPRPHSYNDLKELLGSLHSRFDVAKETVDKKLDVFVRDVKEAMEKMDPSCPEDREMAEQLLDVARACMEMTSAQLRATCESIVQDLTRKRKQCQAGLVKWLFSQLLFILTHCTRVVMFQKETEPIDESSFRKFKECLERIPALETDWGSTPRVDDSGSGYPEYQRNEAGQKFKRRDKESLESETALDYVVPNDHGNNAAREGYAAAKQEFPSHEPQFDSKVVEQRFYLSDEYEAQVSDKHKAAEKIFKFQRAFPSPSKIWIFVSKICS